MLGGGPSAFLRAVLSSLLMPLSVSAFAAVGVGVVAVVFFAAVGERTDFDWDAVWERGGDIVDSMCLIFGAAVRVVLGMGGKGTYDVYRVTY